LVEFRWHSNESELIRTTKMPKLMEIENGHNIVGNDDRLKSESMLYHPANRCLLHLLSCTRRSGCKRLLSSWNNQMDESTQQLAASLTNQNEQPIRRRLALSRAITLIETKHPGKKIQGDLLLTHLLTCNNDNNHSKTPRDSFRIGFAGPPGAVSDVI
jgi:hypothetical protein